MKATSVTIAFRIVLLIGFTLQFPVLADAKIQGSAEPAEGEFNEPSPLLSEDNPLDKSILEKLKKLSDTPDDPALLWELGNAYLRKSWFRHSEGAYLEALNKDENYYKAWGELGTLYMQVGEESKARRAFKEAVAINPGFAGGYYNLGKSLPPQENLSKPSRSTPSPFSSIR